MELARKDSPHVRNYEEALDSLLPLAFFANSGTKLSAKKAAMGSIIMAKTARAARVGHRGSCHLKRPGDSWGVPRK